MSLGLAALLAAQVAAQAYAIPLTGPGDYESILLDIVVEEDSNPEITINVMNGERRSLWLNLPDYSEVDDDGDGRARYAIHAPRGADRIVVSIDGELHEVAVERYEQRNSYIFPLAGNGLVTQGPFNNGGHSGRSTRFAVDVIGLDDLYAPMTANEGPNADMAGFGMDVIAPADGVVTFAQEGVPDRGGNFDYSTLNLPEGTDWIIGNSVIIDHGNGEFFSVQHLREGSVTVAVGDRVVRGQKIGELGNSGDSFGAHLHMQLQNGPMPRGAVGLPVVFEDQGSRILRRGQFVSQE